MIFQGIFIEADVLASKTFNADEKILMIYAKQYNHCEINKEIIVNELGYHSFSKVKNILDKLKEKTSARLDFTIKEDTLTIDFIEDNKRSSIEKLVSSADKVADKRAEKRNSFDNEKEIIEVLEYFKEVTKTKRFSFTLKRKQMTDTLLKDHSPEELKHVIDLKFKEWGNPDSPMNKYLRIETIFRPSKFSGYLESYYRKQNSTKGDSKTKTDNRYKKDRKSLESKGVLE